LCREINLNDRLACSISIANLTEIIPCSYEIYLIAFFNMPYLIIYFILSFLWKGKKKKKAEIVSDLSNFSYLVKSKKEEGR
jgi:hypothetical protein